MTEMGARPEAADFNMGFRSAPKLALRITAVVRLNSTPQPSLWEWALMSEAV